MKCCRFKKHICIILLEPGRPEILELNSKSNSSIQIIWQLLTSQEGSGIITEYIIKVMQDKDENGEQEKRIPVLNSDKGKKRKSEVFDDLKPYTPYSFRVAAVNDKGPGEFSESKMNTTLQGSEYYCIFNLIYNQTHLNVKRSRVV